MINNDNIKDKLKKIPKQPGIYKMLDSSGNIIYIGKSKCLQNRVRSYFVTSPKWEKVNRMVKMIKDIEYVVTDTHLEARLLECRLIKEHKPRFNAQMKNDQRYFFIKVENYNRYNPLSIVEERTENCFGPFRSKYTISEFLNRLRNLYPISKNNQAYDFDFHMFPVTMEESIFNQNKDILLELFMEEDNIGLLIETFQSRLEEASTAYRYEIASIYRDIIKCFRMIKNGLDGYKELASNNILLTIPIEMGYKLFLVSKGNIIHSGIYNNLTQEIKKHFISEGMLSVKKKLLHTSKSIEDAHSDLLPLLSVMPQSGIMSGRVNETEFSSNNEKIWIDYRDILYSEISDLSEEIVEII
jgi:excinuclease ABC subunit C